MQAEAAPKPEVESSETFDLGNLTDPANYKLGEPYRFLVHTTQSPEDKLMQLRVGGGESFSTTNGGTICTSLLDQDHTSVFLGGSAFIINGVGPEAIAATYSTDTGLAKQHQELRFTDGDSLLAATKLLDYNQLNIESGTVGGVMIRFDANSGLELGDPQLNQRMRQIATNRNLPLVEIPVRGQELHPSPAEVALNTGAAGLQLLQIAKPAEGCLVRIDIAEVPQGSILDYSDNSPGCMARVQIIDGYGQLLENDTCLSPASREVVAAAIAEAANTAPTNNLLALARQKIEAWLAPNNRPNPNQGYQTNGA